MKIAKKIGTRKMILLLLLVAAVITAGLFLLRNIDRNDAQLPVNAEGALVVTNLDVGKADAAIVCYKNSTGIVDTGTEDAYATIDAWLRDHGITSIDYMILSHYDKDHIGSAVQILENYPVKVVYHPDYISRKKYYRPLMDELSVDKEGRSVVAVNREQSFQIEDLKIDLIPPEDPEVLLTDQDNMDNNMSLLCCLNLGTKKLLFTGDCEAERLGQLANSSEDYSADWIKLPYHGGFEENETEFLDKVSPKYGVISNGVERKTQKALLKYLKKKKIEYYMTIKGNVTTVCDGLSISMYQK